MIWQSSEKDARRNLALQLLDRPVRAAIILPGQDMIDLRKGYADGLFGVRRTKMVCVEKDPKIASAIEGQLRSFGFKYHLHRGPIETLQESTVTSFLNGSRIDFAFLDFCNQLNQENAQWLINNSDMFAVGAVISFTYAMKTRNKHNRYLESLDLGKFWPYVEMSADQLLQERKYKDDPRRTLLGLWLALSSKQTIKFIEHSGHKAEVYMHNKTPMIFCKTQITKADPRVDYNKYVLPLLSGDSGIDISGIPEWKLLECNPTMTLENKKEHIKRAKVGIRPPWLNKQQWAWNILNPNGMAHRRRN